VTYAGRNRVERWVNRLKQFRRVATRYEKRACNYLAMVELAAALIWLCLRLARAGEVRCRYNDPIVRLASSRPLPDSTAPTMNTSVAR
jgi:hypothetical protein